MQVWKGIQGGDSSIRGSQNTWAALFQSLTCRHDRITCCHSSHLTSVALISICKMGTTGIVVIMSGSATPWTAANQASLSLTISWSLPKLKSTESMMPSNHLILCANPPSPPALNLSQLQGLFQWVSSLHQVAKVLELWLQHQSFQWIFRVDFL